MQKNLRRNFNAYLVGQVLLSKQCAQQVFLIVIIFFL